MRSTSCSVCQREFTRFDNMRRHERVAHGDSSPYPQNTGMHPSITETLPHSLESKPISQQHQNVNTYHNTIQQQEQKQNFVFKHPFTANISGPTSSGKTAFVTSLLQKSKIDPPPQRIIWLYKRWQPLYDVIKETVYPKVEFMQGIPINLEHDAFIDPKTVNLVILDDLMSTSSKDPRINELFTEGSHHRNLSVIAINQNLYYNKDPTQRRNCHYLVIFNNPVDKQQVMTLARQMYPENPQYLMRYFHRATSQPYGYLLIDLKPCTPEHLRMRINILKNTITNSSKTDCNSNISTLQTLDQSHQSKFIRASNDSINYNLSPDMLSCDECGVMFRNEHDLQTHLNTWCPEKRKRKREVDDDENVNSPKKRAYSDGKDDNAMHGENWTQLNLEERRVFNAMMDKARGDNEQEWRKKCEKYMSEGLIKDKANKKADDKMITKDMQRFFKYYGKFIQNTLQLQDGSIHEKIMDDIDRLITHGYDRQKAIKLALHKRRYLFEAMWDFDNYEEETEEEEGEEEGQAKNETMEDETEEQIDDEN